MKVKDLIIIAVLIILVGAGIYLFISGGENIEENFSEIIEKGEIETFVFESVEDARARQIITLYDKVEIEKLQDLRSEELCEIGFERNEILSNEFGRASFTFDESLVGKNVRLSCDQFERFGISQDELLKTRVTSKTELDEKFNCDYGRVTTPTVYFWFISSSDLSEDYCVAPLIVLPQEKDSGECFSEEEVNAMKDKCTDKNEPNFEIPDANGCPTIYCGWGGAGSLCPTEDLLDSSIESCQSEGNVALRYTDDEDCAQIRCSTCANDSKLEEERNDCTSRGGVVEERFDEDTGCGFVYCVVSESYGDVN